MKKLNIKMFAVWILMFSLHSLVAKDCSSKLFSVTIDSTLTIEDVIDNLAETCDLTVIVSNNAAKERMKKNLYYVKLKNSTFKGFLNTILKDNDLSYTLHGNKLKISYFLTKTFRIHYISGQRIGKSNAHVTIANANNSAMTSERGKQLRNVSKTGISIESNSEFNFWKTIETEIQRILMGATDDSMQYVKKGDHWVGANGKVWEYNPLAPIVNAKAGMITVTGTQRQIDRVAKYIQTLSKQIKSQVLIDVRILAVTFDKAKTTGIDWTQLYKMENFAIESLAMAQRNISSFSFDKMDGINDAQFAQGAKPSNAQMVNLIGNMRVSEVIKFLKTQGSVQSISSPRVMTLNNQPALISVGKELFYKVKSSTTSSSSSGTTSSQGELVDSVFAGILLDITPEVGPNGMITLKINPSISEAVDTIKSDGVRSVPPDLVRRQIASVIKVKDGQHAILGGLISSKEGLKINKIPLLGDIPLIEYAFKHEQKVTRTEELVLIITPHVIKNSKSVAFKDLGYKRLNEK